MNTEPRLDDDELLDAYSRSVIHAVEDVGSCSLNLVIALAAKNFVILTGPSGTGKSRSAIRAAREVQFLKSTNNAEPRVH